MARVTLSAVVKKWGERTVLSGFDLDIADRELVVLVGPSGCGKSTVLKLIAGLEDVTSGEILMDGQRVDDLPPKDRDVAMVFQDYALYPHMTVAENMAFGLRVRNHTASEIDKRVREAAAILSLAEVLDKHPKELSGGQQQRVAMGRAIVRSPRAFLFDEPLSNLDVVLRGQMRTEIKKLSRRLRTTAIYVTHDQVEAMTLADRLVVMNRGRIEQIGTPHEVYTHPRTRFVATFIGSPAMNVLPCRLVEREGSMRVLLADEIELTIPEDRVETYRGHTGKKLALGLRPEHLHEAREPSKEAELGLPPRLAENKDDRDAFERTVELTELVGNDTFVHFDIGGIDVCARCTPSAARQPGEPMRFRAEMRQMHLIDATSGEVIPVRDH